MLKAKRQKGWIALRDLSYGQAHCAINLTQDSGRRPYAILIVHFYHARFSIDLTRFLSCTHRRTTPIAARHSTAFQTTRGRDHDDLVQLLSERQREASLRRMSHAQRAEPLVFWTVELLGEKVG